MAKFLGRYVFDFMSFKFDSNFLHMNNIFIHIMNTA